MKPRRLSIRSKLFLAFAITGLITGLLVSVQTFQSASQIIKLNQESTATQLRDIKVEQIGYAINKATSRFNYFANNPELAGQLTDLSAAYHNINTTGTNKLYKSQCSSELEHSFSEKILANLHPARTIQQQLNLSLGDKAIILQCEFVINRDKDEVVPVKVRQYTYFYEIVRNTVESFRQRTELDEILLLDNEGYLVYSTVSKFDLGTSFIDGPWANTSIGVAFSEVSQVLSPDYVRMYDFSFYLPNNFEVTALIASPIISDNNVIGVMIGTITPNKFDDILGSTLDSSDLALGEHGESYIVGSDMLMRSNSRYLINDSVQYTAALKKIKYDPNIADLMVKSGSSILLQRVDTDSVRNMLNGRSGVHNIKDYLDRQVISAYAPLDIPFLDWGVVVELDDYEANALVRKLMWDVLQAMLFVLVVIALITIFVSRVIIKPVSSLTSMVLTFAEGDYSRRLNDNTDDEMGKLARAFDSMADTITDRSHGILRANNALMLEVEERKQMQGELQRKRDFVASILDSQRLISIITRSDGSIVRVNRATEEIVGYKADELSVITDNLFSKVDLLQKDLSGMIELVLAGHYQKFVMDVYTKSGEKRVISWVVSKLERSISELSSLKGAPTNQGKIQFNANIATNKDDDIDGTKRSENRQPEDGQQKDVHLEEGLIKDHLQKDNLQNNSLVDDKLLGDKKGIDTATVAAKGDEPYSRVDRSNDTSVIADTYLIWNGLDITDQRKVEAELADQARIIQSLTSSAQDGIFITDDSGKIITWNISAQKMFGYTQEEILWEQVVPRLIPMEYKEIFKQASSPSAKQEGLTVDAAGIHKEGHRFPVEVSMSAIKVNDRWSTFYVVRDTSIRVMREHELQEAYEKASIAEHAKTVFLANMSHEIRTPLNGILGFVELLNNTKLNRMQGDYLKVISGSADSLIMIVNEILDFSKIESGHMQLEDIEFDLYAQIEYAAELFVVAARDKGIELVIDIDTKVPTSLIGDPLRIRQIISNLLSNSIKFTHKGGKIALGAEFIKEGSFDCTLRLFVSDNGVGIDKEYQKHIFEAFGQEDTSVTRKHGGTGLGLTISAKLANLMGSELELESVKGGGSKFWFDMTLRKGELSASISTDKFADVKVGVLRDSDIQEEILIRYLKALKCDVAPFDNLADLSKVPNLRLVFASYVTCINDDECNNVDLFMERGTLVLIDSSKSGRSPEIINKNVRVLGRPVSYNKIRAILNDVIYGDKKQPTIINKKRYIGDILLVEDNIINQELVKIILSNYDLKCTIVNNGEEALKKIKERKNKFDIILMDIHMPIMDGVTATKEYIEWAQGNSLDVKPVIALTANVIEEDRKRYLKVGMKDFIAKPIDIKTLENILDKYLELNHDNNILNKKISSLEVSNLSIAEPNDSDKPANIAVSDGSSNKTKEKSNAKTSSSKVDTDADIKIAHGDGLQPLSYLAQDEIVLSDEPDDAVSAKHGTTNKDDDLVADDLISIGKEDAIPAEHDTMSQDNVAIDKDIIDTSIIDRDIDDKGIDEVHTSATPLVNTEIAENEIIPHEVVQSEDIQVDLTDDSEHDKGTLIEHDEIDKHAEIIEHYKPAHTEVTLDEVDRPVDDVEISNTSDIDNDDPARVDQGVSESDNTEVGFESVMDRLAPKRANELRELIEAIGIDDVSFINQLLGDFKMHSIQQVALMKELIIDSKCEQALEISAKLNGVAVNLRQQGVIDLIEKLDEDCLKGDNKASLKTLNRLANVLKKIEQFAFRELNS